MAQPKPLDFAIPDLGPRKVVSPYKAHRYVSDDELTLYRTPTLIRGRPDPQDDLDSPLGFELAGAREKIYFDPAKTRCGVVTCGGLCPGLNDVIRAIALQLHYHYGVRTTYGFRYGFEGLVPSYGHETIILDPKTVSHIHRRGGTILASSHGPQSPEEMVDSLERLNIQLLFCIGGDATFRGALDLVQEIRERKLKICVIAVPKTIDNDISFTSRTFGFETAFSVAVHAAMAGKTAMFVGYWNNQFTHVPIAAAVSNAKRIDPNGRFWQSVVECTGQPNRMTNDGKSIRDGEEMLLSESCAST